MVRAYQRRPVDRAVLDRVIDAGLRAPSAGFSQGSAFVVLEGDRTADFWKATERPGSAPVAGGRLAHLRDAPVVIVPFAHKSAYLERYSEPDKVGLGLDDESGWPVPYWDIDTAFSVMAILLAATDAGLGALFFGLFAGDQALRACLDVPEGFRAIGAITLGWPAVDDPSPSLARGRRPRSERVHYGQWNGGSTGTH
ncbi:MAG: hypothetical protein NVS3B21_08070 [Acidimicrobiales bacterium]